MRSDHSTLAKGERVDHYRIMRLLGRGGMGEVYLARDAKLGRKVALKIIHAEGLSGRDAQERFRQEAQVTARFSHPNIVAIYGVGEYQGAPYVALEYLPGETLQRRLETDRLTLRESVRVGLAVARALAEAHRHGVLHRDLKPANVLLGVDGRVRVLDFGLAKAMPDESIDVLDTLASGPSLPAPVVDGGLDDTAPGEREARDGPGSELVTRPGQLAGTPLYMAPEQWDTRPVGPEVDVWAFGVLMYQLASGRVPFSATSITQLCYAICGSDPIPTLARVSEPPDPENADLFAALSEITEWCLQRPAERRPKSADLVDELTALNAPGRYRGSLSGKDPNPFRGLLPFGERHADFFFGREAEIAALSERLREEPRLPLVGPSGAGKSSLVQAGLIPRIRERGPWIVLRIRPGRAPFESLAARLLSGDTASGSSGLLGRVSTSLERLLRTTADGQVITGEHPAIGPNGKAEGDGDSPGKSFDLESLAAALRRTPARLGLLLSRLAEREEARVLLFVDQLEELSSLVEDEATRQAFMEALSGAADDPASPVRVIMTLRDDFLVRLAETPVAREVLSRMVVINRPGDDALQEILQSPVEAVGYAFEDDTMPREMLAELAGESAALPLMQFACQQLWERRDRSKRLITRAAYEEIGGVAGALAQYADRVSESLSADQIPLSRDLFLRLVRPDATRRIVPRDKLLDGLDPGAAEVLDHWIGARTIVTRRRGGAESGTGESELELVHESLATNWQPLVRWLEESREERIFLAEIEEAASLWERRRRPEDGLWRGVALVDARRKAARAGPLPRVVSAFLAACNLAAVRRRRRRRWLFSAGGGTLVLIAVAAVLVSVVIRKQRDRAVRAHRQAVKARRHVESQRAEALREGARAALLSGDNLEARARLRSSLELRDSPTARALWWRLTLDPIQWSKSIATTFYGVDVSPDGGTVAVAGMDHTAYLINVATLAVRVLRSGAGQVQSVAFSPDGRHLAMGTIAGQVELHDLKRKTRRILRGHRLAVRGLVFTSDGRILASTGYDAEIRIWDVAKARTLRVMRGHTSRVYGLSFHPDDRQLVSGSKDGTVRLWDIRTGTQRRILRGNKKGVYGVRFSRDGSRVASAGVDSTVRVWDTASGQPLTVLTGHENRVYSVDFSPDGKLLASSGYDGTVRLWSTDRYSPLLVHHAHRARVYAVRFDPKGRYLASAGFDKAVRLWKVKGRPPRRVVGGHTAGVFGLAFRPDGKRLVSSSFDATVRIWDRKTGRTRQVLSKHIAPVLAVEYGPRGKLLATGSDDNTIRIWDAETGRALGVWRGHRASVLCLRFSRDGRLLATGSYDETVRIWDVANGRLLHTLRGHGASIWSVDFSPDGTLLASTGLDHTVRIWMVRDGSLQTLLRDHKSSVWGVRFSPDGKLLASASSDRTVRIWRVDAHGKTVPYKTLGPHGSTAQQPVWHPDGKRLGVSLSDGTSRIWDVTTGHYLVLKGHRAEVRGFAFSPDGAEAATTSDDGTLRLWKTATGHPLWRAPLLWPDPPKLLTHVGWVRLDGASSASSRKESRWSQVLAQAGIEASLSPDRKRVCVRTQRGALALWDVVADRRLIHQKLAALTRVIALPGAGGCLALAGSEARIYAADGTHRVVARGVSAMTVARERILLAVKNRIHVHRLDGRRERVLEANRGMTALGVVTLQSGQRALMVGYRDGNPELMPWSPGASAAWMRFSFESVPSSPVTRLSAGPPGTVIIAFSNGTVGLWSLRNGMRLHVAHLHGPVVHLLRQKGHFYAATELGQHLRWDLGIFDLPYCDLLRRIWDQVPVVWERGLPVLRRPPRAHSCRVSRAGVAASGPR